MKPTFFNWEDEEAVNALAQLVAGLIAIVVIIPGALVLIWYSFKYGWAFVWGIFGVCVGIIVLGLAWNYRKHRQRVRAYEALEAKTRRELANGWTLAVVKEHYGPASAKAAREENHWPDWYGEESIKSVFRKRWENMEKGITYTKKVGDDDRNEVGWLENLGQQEASEIIREERQQQAEEIIRQAREDVEQGVTLDLFKEAWPFDIWRHYEKLGKNGSEMTSKPPDDDTFQMLVSKRLGAKGLYEEAVHFREEIEKRRQQQEEEENKRRQQQAEEIEAQTRTEMANGWTLALVEEHYGPESSKVAYLYDNWPYFDGEQTIQEVIRERIRKMEAGKWEVGQQQAEEEIEKRWQQQEEERQQQEEERQQQAEEIIRQAREDVEQGVTLDLLKEAWPPTTWLYYIKKNNGSEMTSKPPDDMTLKMLVSKRLGAKGLYKEAAAFQMYGK